MMNKVLPKIALGAWSWGTGAAGGDQVFGNHLFEKDLQPVFNKAMECGLTLWDTAAVYGEGQFRAYSWKLRENVCQKISLFLPSLHHKLPAILKLLCRIC